MKRINMNRFKALFPIKPNKELQQIFGVSSTTVSRVAKMWGLKKDQAYWSGQQTKRNYKRWGISVKHTIVDDGKRRFCIMCELADPSPVDNCPFYSLLEPSGGDTYRLTGAKHLYTLASDPLCMYCGGPRANATRDCPRMLLTQDQVDRVRAFVLDFRDGKWIEL